MNFCFVLFEGYLWAVRNAEPPTLNLRGYRTPSPDSLLFTQVKFPQGVPETREADTLLSVEVKRKKRSYACPFLWGSL